MVEGLAKGKQDGLILPGTKRFGEPDPQNLEAVRAATDFDRCDAVLSRILEAEGWDDVLAPVR